MNYSISETNNRQFKGVWIPAEIWLRTDLGCIEKCLLAEIDSFSSVSRGCFASDEYLANLMQLSIGRIKNLISDLRKKGLVKTVAFDGRHRELRVTAEVTNSLPLESRKRDSTGNENVTPECSSNILLENSIEKRIENRNGSEAQPPRIPSTNSRMEKPSLEYVKAKAMEIDLSPLEAEKFFNYYESNGWRVGKNPMKSWTAALRTWKLNSERYSSGPSHQISPSQIRVIIEEKQRRIDQLKETGREMVGGIRMENLSREAAGEIRALRTQIEALRAKISSAAV